MTLALKKTTLADLETAVHISEEGIASLAKTGSPQWQNGYGPSAAQLKQDISKEQHYFLMKATEVVGMASLIAVEDPVYTAIQAGQWQSAPTAYVAIHRVVIRPGFQGKGLATILLRLLTQEAQYLGYQDIRIDTHMRNQPMKKAIVNAGFHYRGEVTFPIPDGQRRAYQCVIA